MATAAAVIAKPTPISQLSVGGGGAPKFTLGSTATTTTTPSMENVFGNKEGLSFANLSQAAKPFGFGGGFGSTSASALFGGGGGTKQPPMLFGQAKPASAQNNEEDEEGGGGDNQNPEEYEPQVEFKPLVKLSEVKSLLDYIDLVICQLIIIVSLAKFERLSLNFLLFNFGEETSCRIYLI